MALPTLKPPTGRGTVVDVDIPPARSGLQSTRGETIVVQPHLDADGAIGQLDQLALVHARLRPFFEQ